MSIAHRTAQQSTSENHLPVRCSRTWESVESVQAAVRRQYPGGSGAGCKTTGMAQVLLDTTQRFWPNAEYAKHRGVTRMKVGVRATMVFASLIAYPIASFAGLAPDADNDGIPDV